jgi:hypothetical protein
MEAEASTGKGRPFFLTGQGLPAYNSQEDVQERLTRHAAQGRKMHGIVPDPKRGIRLGKSLETWLSDLERDHA